MNIVVNTSIDFVPTYWSIFTQSHDLYCCINEPFLNYSSGFFTLVDFLAPFHFLSQKVETSWD